MIILVAKGRGRGGRGKGRGAKGRGARGGARGAGTSDLRRSNRVKEKDRSYNAEEEVEEVKEEVILASSQQIAFKPSSALPNNHPHNNHPSNNHWPNNHPPN